MQLDSLAVVEGVVEGEYLGDVLKGVRSGVRLVLAHVVLAGVPGVHGGGYAGVCFGLVVVVRAGVHAWGFMANFGRCAGI